MPASYTDWPVEVRVMDRPEAEKMRHDSVPPPEPAQRDRWIKQLEDEEEEPLPFTDD